MNEHHHEEFYQKLRELPRERLLEIIDKQDPETTREIARIEDVFKYELRHLNWDDGTQIRGRDLTDEELIRLIDPPFIYSQEKAQMGFNEAAQRQIHIASDTVLWSKHFLNVRPRVYQTLMLRNPSTRKVMRLGRRMGKSYSLAMLILWYAYTNKDARVIVISPMKTQVGLLFEAIQEFREEAPLVDEAIKRAVTAPQYEMEFTNGSTVRFFTSGMKSGGKADVARGQEGDLIVLDEMDYMGPEDLVALMAMLQTTSKKKTTRKALVGASTPTGLQSKFWEWNTKPESGFEAFWFPSYCNPEWTQETEDEMRMFYSDPNHYRHEIEADWGEPAAGVYPRHALDRAFVAPGWPYKLEYNPESHYIMGVDWDKYGAGVNLVILEICGRNYEDERCAGKIRLAFREEIIKGEFTYTAAVDRILYLDSVFHMDWIYVDRGAGEMQLEVIKKRGMEDPRANNIHKRVKGFQFSESKEVRDPFTKQPEKKEIKAFMVDNLYRMLEEDQLIFSEDDDEMYFQLISYVVIRNSAYGKPIFGPGGQAVDHAHDALILACMAVADNYDDLLKIKFARNAQAVNSEAFLNLFAVESKEDEEIAKETWDNPASAPLMVRRAMTANVKGSRNNRADAIKRKMF